MSRFLKITDTVCRWLFVLVTWLVCVVFLYDYWQTFQGLITAITSGVPLPGLLLGGMIVLGLAWILISYGKLLRFSVVLLFFLSVAVLYSYVGSRLSTTLSTVLDVKPEESLKVPNNKES
jgi:hypothetical protein